MLPGWEIAEQNGVEQKKISLYFSPSCPACREAIEIFSGRARFYPVAENDEDYLSIADISNRVQNGESMPAAISAVRAEQQAGTWVAPHLSLWQRMRGSIKIMRNQAAVLRHGYSSLPVMVFEGLPASWVEQNRIDGGAPLQPESGGSMDALPGIEQPGTSYPDTQDLPQDPALPEQPAGNGQAGTTAPYQPASPELPLDFGDTLECGRGSEAPCD